MIPFAIAAAIFGALALAAAVGLLFMTVGALDADRKQQERDEEARRRAEERDNEKRGR